MKDRRQGGSIIGPDDEAVDVFGERTARLSDVCEVWKSPLWHKSTANNKKKTARPQQAKCLSD